MMVFDQFTKNVQFTIHIHDAIQVRSLESTIHGLEHTIAVGQGVGMEELTEAQIRSEVLKLQQEMDHLVHGLPSMQVKNNRSISKTYFTCTHRFRCNLLHYT
jgi:uncharacterized coiled-coil protein SlyX